MRTPEASCAKRPKPCARCCRRAIRTGATQPRSTASRSSADDIFRDVLLAVRRSFITPFDRSDIHDLITAMDDAIDQMRKTTKSIDLFEMRSLRAEHGRPRRRHRRQRETRGRVRNRLRKMQSNAPRLHELSEQITGLEERSDELHDTGLKALFHAHGANQAMNFVIGADVYGHLERVVDRIEDVGKYVNSIVVEHL